MNDLQAWSPEQLLEYQETASWASLLARWVQARENAYEFVDLLQAGEDYMKENEGGYHEDLMDQIGRAIALHGRDFNQPLLRDLLRDHHGAYLLNNPAISDQMLYREARRWVLSLIGERPGGGWKARKGLVHLLDVGWTLPQDLKEKLLEKLQQETVPGGQEHMLWRSRAGLQRQQRSAYEVLHNSADLTSQELQTLYRTSGRESVGDAVELLTHPAADQSFVEQLLNDVEGGQVEWEYYGPLLEALLNHPVGAHMPRARRLIRELGEGQTLWDLLAIADKPGERGEIVLKLLKSAGHSVFRELQEGGLLVDQLRPSDGAVLLSQTEGERQQRLLRLLGRHNLLESPTSSETPSPTTEEVSSQRKR